MNSAISLPRRALDRVWHSRFARNVAVVASGTAGVHAITLAFASLITRNYELETFALLGTFMVAVAVAVAVAVPPVAPAYAIPTVPPRHDRDNQGLRGSGDLSSWAALRWGLDNEPFLAIASDTQKVAGLAQRPGGAGL